MEEQNKQINELRTAVNSHASDSELRTIVDNVTTQFYDIFRLKGNAAKADVFHILSGMWKTPAERCFMWIGGFRPSELLKVCPLIIGCFMQSMVLLIYVQAKLYRSFVILRNFILIRHEQCIFMDELFLNEHGKATCLGCIEHSSLLCSRDAYSAILKYSCVLKLCLHFTFHRRCF